MTTQKSSLRSIVFSNFTGGINTVKSPAQVLPTEFADAQDYDLFPLGGISKRGGLVQPGTTHGGNGANSFRFYGGVAGVNHFSFGVGHIYAYSQDFSTETDLIGALTVTSNAPYLYTMDILNDTIAACNGKDQVVLISNVPAASAFSGPFSTALFPIQFRGYMFYCNVTVSGTPYPDRIYFSDVNDPTTVGANNFIDVLPKQGGQVLGACVLNGYLYIFKRNAIVQISYSPTAVDANGDLFPFTENPNPIVYGYGTKCHRTICTFVTPATHVTPGVQYAFFIDQFGIPRVFDGTIQIGFESKIGTKTGAAVYALTDMDSTQIEKDFSVNYQFKNRVLFTTNASDFTVTWVLDYQVGFAIMRYNFFTSMYDALVCEKTDGTFKPHFVRSNGQFHELDTTHNYDNISTNKSVISGYITTGDVNDGTLTRMMQFYQVYLRGASVAADGFGGGNIGLTYNLNADYINNAIGPNTVALSPPGLVTAIDGLDETRITAKSLQIILADDNGKLTIQQFALLFTPLDVSEREL